MNNIFDKLAEALLKPVNTSAVIFCGVLTFAWGLWVAVPFWTVFDRSALYTSMESIGEVPIGLVAMLAGLIIMYGAVKQRPPYIYYGAAAGALFWLGVTGFFLYSDWQNPGWMLTLTVVVYCAYVYANVKVNYKK